MTGGTQNPFGRSLKVRVLVALAFGVCLIFAVSACGKPGSVDSAIGVPDAPDTPSVSPSPTPMPGPVLLDKIHEPVHYGAASPPVEARIYQSDVIVRASLWRARPGWLNFKVIEYLKGTGPGEIVVVSGPMSGRDTTWDDREAVLFLSRAKHDGAEAHQFTFANVHYKYPAGHSIDTLDPAWLPALADVAGNGASSSGNQVYITDSGVATGGPRETISLDDLRATIAWIDGGEDGEDAEAYRRCIGMALNYLVYDRDWEAHYGRPWTPDQFEEQMASGAAEGTALYDSGLYEPHRGEPGYSRFWLSGQDAAYFSSLVYDDDNDAVNGYHDKIVAIRPLPAGVYRFTYHAHDYGYTACDFTPDNHRLDWIVTAEAPSNAVHGAFFDPVSIGTAVGSDAEIGVLQPASFRLTGGGTASLRKIAWESGQVTIEFESPFSLEGHHADFIALDGSVGLRLDFDDGIETVDGVERTLVWNVCTQPWQSGDLLMLRISESEEDLPDATNDGPCPPLVAGGES